MHSWRDVSINSLFASVVREVTRSAQHFLPPPGAEPILTPVHSEINRFNEWLVRQPSGSIYVAVMHSFTGSIPIRKLNSRVAMRNNLDDLLRHSTQCS